MLFKTRYHILTVVIALYFFPLFILIAYDTGNNLGNRWQILSAGLLLLSLGSLCLFLLLRYWEKAIAVDSALDQGVHLHEKSAPTESLISLEEAEERGLALEGEVAALVQNNEELQTALADVQQLVSDLHMQKEQLLKEISVLRAEFNQVKESSEEKLEQNQIFLREYQQTITEQRQVIEVKQQQIQQLDDKVRDLTYEIKTLLHLAEKSQVRDQRNFTVTEPALKLSDAIEEPSSLQAPVNFQLGKEGQASYQLKHCIDIAQKMTGASHYTNRSGKRADVSMDHYALDLRCLIDSLRNENSCAILIYSQKENKVIFGNAQVKPLLGWNSEKFIQNFSSIIEESAENWSAALAQLAYKNECQAELSMKSKSGVLVPVKCYLGVIATGIFRSNILGLLYNHP